MKTFLILAAITLLVRLPFFFPDVIDPDESTYILMGQDILDGNLPYSNLWAFMPPLSLYCFSAMIVVLGKTIPSIRLGGTLFMLMAAWFVYLSGMKLKNERTGFIAAVFLILYSAVSMSGGSTTSETLAIVPLTGALLLFLREGPGAKDFFIAGLLISCACLIRLNLVYLALLSVPLVLHGGFFRSKTALLPRTAAYAAGGIIPVVLFFIPFALSGRTQLIITTLYEAPLKYSSSQMSSPEALYSYLVRFTGTGYLLENGFLAAVFLGALAYIALSWRNFPEKTRRRMVVVLFFLAATGISILRTGQAYEHYLVQVFPFIALVAAFFLDHLLNLKAKTVIAFAAAILMLAPASVILNAYRPVVSRAVAGERLTFGPAYEIAEYLKKENPGNAPIYCMYGHITHWLTNTKPIAGIVVHPSNLAREYLLKAVHGPSGSVESELADILAKEPAFIVKPVIVNYLKPYPAAYELLTEKLFMDYELDRVFGELMVYRHL